MKPRHKVSAAAIELIKRFEGYRRRAARLPGGGWTIGYGHTASAREGAEVSPQDAHALLLYDVGPVAIAVNDWTFTPLTQNQFDALVAFAFNVGLDAFKESNVLRRINEGALLEAAAALETWRRAVIQGEPVVVDALVRRRAAEKALFLTPPGGFVPAPSPVVRPKMDYAAVPYMLTERPVEVTAPLEGEDATAELTAEAAEPDEGPELPFDEEPAAPETSVVDPEEDEESSPAVLAADAVTQRLQALFPEDQLAPARDDAEAAPRSEDAPQAMFEPAALAPAEAEHFAQADEQDETPPLGHPSPPHAEEEAAPAADAVETLQPREAPATPEIAPTLAPVPEAAEGEEPGYSRTRWLGTGLAGIALLAIGFTILGPLGWASGIFGIVLIGVSLYFLLVPMTAEYDEAPAGDRWEEPPYEEAEEGFRRIDPEEDRARLAALAQAQEGTNPPDADLPTPANSDDEPDRRA